MDEDRRAMSSSESDETSDVEAMDTEEPSSPSSESSSMSSNSDHGDNSEENDDESELSSSPSSSSSSMTSLLSESDDDNYLDWVDFGPFGGIWPEVLDKRAPIDKFSFVKALTERQWEGDGVRRKLANRFIRQACGSRKLMQRLELQTTLQKHERSTQCISFNDAGNILISSSKDRHVCLWDWSRSKNLLYFGTKDVAKQVEFLPNSGDTELVTCGAGGRIRLCTLDQCSLRNIGVLFDLPGSYLKLALQNQTPNTFLVASLEGGIHSIDIRSSNPLCTKLAEVAENCTTSTEIKFRVKSIHCNPIKSYEFIVSGHGKEVFLFDQRRITVENPQPAVTCTPTECDFPVPYVSGSLFNYNGTEIISSYCSSSIYLFDAQSGKQVHRYTGHRQVDEPKCVNFFGPRSEYIISGSDRGHVFFWDKNSEAIVHFIKADQKLVRLVEPHPALPILATSGSKRTVRIWTPTKNANDVVDVDHSSHFLRTIRRNHHSVEQFRNAISTFLNFLKSSRLSDE